MAELDGGFLEELKGLTYEPIFNKSFFWPVSCNCERRKARHPLFGHPLFSYVLLTESATCDKLFCDGLDGLWHSAGNSLSGRRRNR
jgi:hypothetical protein